MQKPIPRKPQFFAACTLACASLLLATSAPALAANKAQLAEAMSVDGLQPIKLKGVDMAYARPGASLAGYKRIKLDPVEVSFSKSWDPKRTGSNFSLSTEEREHIRSGVAKIVEEEFARELSRKDGYQIVTEAGPDVLRVKATIINLYVNAPDTPSAGMSRTYVMSAGEMSLIAELYDSETGQVLARMADRREAQNTGRMSMSNRVFNASEAEMIASAWARILRKSLDKAHEIGKP